MKVSAIKSDAIQNNERFDVKKFPANPVMETV
jgi:hypothetical protein